MQASPAWIPPTGTLGGIVLEARQRASVLRARERDLERAARSTPPAKSFADALRSDMVAVIAEIKRRSPSKGVIKPGMTAVDQARAYEHGGAAAISVLTEPVHFEGSIEDLVAVRAAVGLPVLKKDFHIDPVQLLEAKAIGASAALLIVRALAPKALRQMADAARQLQLETLIEVRDEAELARALDAGANVIGINNRNLETLEIDPDTSERLLRLVPSSVLAVAESGVTGRGDVERAARAGADAVLVGSVVSAANDPAGAVLALSGVKRVSRVG